MEKKILAKIAKVRGESLNELNRYLENLYALKSTVSEFSVT